MSLFDFGGRGLVKKGVLAIVFGVMFFSLSVFAKPIMGVSSDILNVAPYYDQSNDDFFRSWLSYKVSPGSVIDDAIEVENLTEKPLTMSVKPVDAVKGTVGESEEADRFAMGEMNAQNEYVGSWTRIGDDQESMEIVLEPKESRILPVKISVPEDLEDGDYWGAVAFDEPQKTFLTRIEGTAAAEGDYYTKIKLGTRILLRVDSKIEGVERLAAGAALVDDYRADFGDKLRALALWKKIVLFLSGFYLLSFIMLGLFDRVRKVKSKKKNISKKFENFFRWAIVIFIGVAISLAMFAPSRGLTSLLSTQKLNGLGIAPAPVIGENGQIIDKPQKFVIDGVKPGDVVNLEAMVINNDPVDSLADLFPSDAELGESGSFAIAGSNFVSQSIGKWTTLEVEETIVPAQTSKIVPFKIEIPENAPVGKHYGAIVVGTKPAPKGVSRGGEVIEAVADEGNSNGSFVEVVTQVGARVYLTVAGDEVVKTEFHDFELEQRENGVLYLHMLLDNLGTVKVRPVVNISLLEGGEELDKYLVKGLIDDFFLGKDYPIEISLPWKSVQRGGALNYGEYELSVDMSDGENTANELVAFAIEKSAAPIPVPAAPGVSPVAPVVVPDEVVDEPGVVPAVEVPADDEQGFIGSTWFYIMIVMLLIVLIGIIIFFWKRKKDEQPQQPVPPVAQPQQPVPPVAQPQQPVPPVAQPQQPVPPVAQPQQPVPPQDSTDNSGL